MWSQVAIPFNGGGGGEGGIGNGNATLVFGANNVTSTPTTRYLYPGYENSSAQTVPLQIEVPRKGTVKNLTVRHNTPAGNGNVVRYTLMQNGVATGVEVDLASTGTSASDLVNTADFAQGDELGVRVTKPGGAIGSGNLDVTVSMEFA